VVQDTDSDDEEEIKWPRNYPLLNLTIETGHSFQLLSYTLTTGTLGDGL
jgi:hypothetical protein